MCIVHHVLCYSIHSRSPRHHLPSGSVIPLWASYCPVARIEVEGWLGGPNPYSSSNWPNLQGDKTIWESRNPLGADDWLLSSYVVWVERNNLGARCTHSPQIPVIIMSYACFYIVNIAWQNLLDWLPRTNQSGGGRLGFAFTLALFWKYPFFEKAVHRTSSVDQSFKSISRSLRGHYWDTHFRPFWGIWSRTKWW